MLTSLDRNVFHIGNHSHHAHLNQIHAWYELNRLHFPFHHFNQSSFQGMLKILSRLQSQTVDYHLRCSNSSQIGELSFCVTNGNNSLETQKSQFGII
jgi:predicted NAD/FAD-binding protein